jgi:hypothetical protein
VKTQLTTRLATLKSEYEPGDQMLAEMEQKLNKKASTSMHTQLRTRLATLKSEQEAGERLMAELEQKQRNLRDTLLRISGAIQVIEELLAQPEEPPPDTPANSDPGGVG